jgi:Pyruvate/2-oxoacid:ferredoxin oxidoreductase delta subunit
MIMAKRNIVKIDEDKCTGCGLCVTACAEGAIQIIGGKAKLVSDTYCDGLGACLGHCPEDAITIEQREAAEFDEQAVHEHLQSQQKVPPQSKPSIPFTCPGMAAQQFKAAQPASDDAPGEAGPSQLSHWPVQLHLLAPQAACFADADLLLAADCVPFAMADFHQRYLKGRSVAVGCPKLDDTSVYVEKLAEILRSNNLRSLTVVHMEVPCCAGMTRTAREAILRSGKAMSFTDVTVAVRGDVLQSQTMNVSAPTETAP